MTEVIGEFQFLSEDYKEVLKKLQVKHGIELRPIKRITNGKSGARLYLVSASSSEPNKTSHLILKLDQPVTWEPNQSSEIERHRSASDSVDANFQKHIPEIEMGPEVHGAAYGVLYRIAGESIQDYRPIGFFPEIRAIASQFQHVSRELLSNFNKGKIELEHGVSPTQLLGRWLGYRIDEQASNIPNFLQDNCDFRHDSEGLLYNGDLLPNPFLYARNPDTWGSVRGLDSAIGFVHGDLNTNNVLYRLSKVTQNIEDFYFIDFAMFEQNSYLFYDHAYLWLSYLYSVFEQFTFDKWSGFLNKISNPWSFASENVPAEFFGMALILQKQMEAVKEWILSVHPSLQDDLRGQFMLANVAAGLNFCNKANCPKHFRFFSFVYSAIYLRTFLELFEGELPSSAENLSLSESIGASDPGGNWEGFFQEASHFETGRTYILVSGPKISKALRELLPLARLPWDFIVDFDVSSYKEGGLYGTLKDGIETHRALHLVGPDNDLNFGASKATTWYAAKGLHGRDEQTWLQWKLAISPHLASALKRLAELRGGLPCTVIVMWDGKEFVQKVCDLITDFFGATTRFVLVNHSSSKAEEIVRSYNAKLVDITANQIAAGVSKLFPEKANDLGPVFLPAADESLSALESKDLLFLEEELTVLHSGVAFSLGQRPDASFLRGTKITWSELDLDRDVSRTKTHEISKQVTNDLDNRRAVRVNLYHYPGAGGTTVARRIAWDLHTRYPVVELKKVSETTISRLSMLTELTGLPLLVLVESANVLLDLAESLYYQARSQNLPVVFLVVIRKAGSAEEGLRAFYLSEQLDVAETRRFVNSYSEERPAKKSVIESLASGNDRPRTPFFFGLVTYEEDFMGLPNYVQARIEKANDSQKKILVYLAISFRYGHYSVPSQFFMFLTDKDSAAALKLDEYLTHEQLSLLVREKDDFVVWRPVHYLIAGEMIVQLLGDSKIQYHDWAENLDTWAIRFIEDLAAIFLLSSQVKSEDVFDLLRRLLIVRDSYEQYEYSEKEFSPLVMAIPPSGREAVFRSLVKHFPEDAHFWAHLGRFLSTIGNHSDAIIAHNKALSIEQKDDVLFHMKGMSLRRYAESLMQKQRRNPENHRGYEKIEELVQDSETAFENSRGIDQFSEYSYVSNIKLLTRYVEFGFKLSGHTSYADFLADKEFLKFHEVVERAEYLLDKVKQLSSGERRPNSKSIYVVSAESSLKSLLGDYSKVIAGWKSLLGQSGYLNPGIRRRIAYAYLARKNRNWDALPLEEITEITDLIQKNIDTEPNEDRNYRIWFDAARRNPGVPLEVAISRLQKWSNRSSSVDILYYLYICHVLKAIEGSEFSRGEAIGFIERLREETRNSPFRKDSINWLGSGEGLRRIVHSSLLGDWLVSMDFYPNTKPLARIPGSIRRINKPESGVLVLDCGLDVFFVPGRSGGARRFYRGVDENLRVEFFLGFSYDGLRAWNVAPL